MPPLSVLMEMAFLLQISASPIEVNFNADMNEKPENIYSIYYPTITTRIVDKVIELELPASSDGIRTLIDNFCRSMPMGSIVQLILHDFKEEL